MTNIQTNGVINKTHDSRNNQASALTLQTEMSNPYIEGQNLSPRQFSELNNSPMTSMRSINPIKGVPQHAYADKRKDIKRKSNQMAQIKPIVSQIGLSATQQTQV